MILSTLGFIYTPDFSEVRLIEKQKPASHKGKLNGLGGKCEVDESPEDCMSREVKEESDIFIPAQEWKKVGVLHWEEWNVEIFICLYKGDKQAAKSMTQDKVDWYPVNSLPANVLTNLPWLIPLGIDYLTNECPPFVKVEYP